MKRSGGQRYGKTIFSFLFALCFGLLEKLDATEYKCCRGFSFWSAAKDRVQSFGATCVQLVDKLYLFYVFSSRLLRVNMRHHFHVEKLKQNVVRHRDWAWTPHSLQKQDSLDRHSGGFTITPVVYKIFNRLHFRIKVSREKTGSTGCHQGTFSSW